MGISHSALSGLLEKAGENINDQYTFSTKGLVFKKFENCLTKTFGLQIQHLLFSVGANFVDSSHYNVDLILIKSLKICPGFDR